MFHVGAHLNGTGHDAFLHVLYQAVTSHPLRFCLTMFCPHVCHNPCSRFLTENLLSICLPFVSPFLRLFSARFGLIRFDSVRSVRSVGFDSVRSVRSDPVRFGLIRLGSIRSDRFGSIRSVPFGLFGSFPRLLQEREGIIKDTEALFRLRKKQASAAKAQVIPKMTTRGDGLLTGNFVISICPGEPSKVSYF